MINKFPEQFICATEKYSKKDDFVNAPIFRKTFYIQKKSKEITLTICGLGFYRLFINGKEISSFLAPYISNPDHVLYYNRYNVKRYIKKGNNVICCVLGNGFLNNVEAGWFKNSPFRSSPKVAFTLINGKQIIESDESVKVCDSPILFDDTRVGERYDARLEQKHFNIIAFDDSKWKNAIKAITPSGEKKICSATPVKLFEKIKPINVIKGKGGYIYDFGIVSSGIFKLKIKGTVGQKIKIVFSELIKDGKADMSNINFVDTPPDFNQTFYYTCNGKKSVYSPSFCYIGYRYAYITGITDKQAKPNLLTMIKAHADFKKTGNFDSSDKVLNKIYSNTCNSVLSNFYWSLNDCPQREKNGWTGDINLSANLVYYYFSARDSFREWLLNLRKAQRENGCIPAIVPTSEWGYEKVNGPAWDEALIEVTLRDYQYYGDKLIIEENADAIFKYIKYTKDKLNENYLAEYGLGDWCEVNNKDLEHYRTPIVITNTIVVCDILNKASILFGIINRNEYKEIALNLLNKVKKSFRERFIDSELYVKCKTQTAQAMAIYYDIFNNNEIPVAVKNLVSLIHSENDEFRVGVLGARVLFRTLAKYGYCDLAYKMITRDDALSFGYQINHGATSLWESFFPLDEFGNVIGSDNVPPILSRNHHFWGDVSSFFAEDIVGLNINPFYHNVNYFEIRPHFVSAIKWATTYHNLYCGRVVVGWRRLGKKIVIKVKVPKGTRGKLMLTDGSEVIIDKNKKIIIQGTDL